MTTAELGRQLQTLEDRTFKTYKARLECSRRLASRGAAWNASLLATSISTTVASIGLLTDGGMYGRSGPTALVCLSSAALFVSLVVANADYNSRSRDMFTNYRRIQRLSAEIEALRLTGAASGAEVLHLQTRYQDILDESENHSEADFQRASGATTASFALTREGAVSLLPWISLALPVVSIIPLIRWIFF